MLVSDVSLTGENRNELPSRRDIHHWRGNTRKIMFRLADESGEGLELDGYTVKLAIKPVTNPGEDNEVYDDEATPVCEVDDGETNSTYVQGLAGSDSELGYVYIYLSSDDTNFAGGKYYYGIELSGTDNENKDEVRTPLVGIWYQYEDIVDNG